MGKQTFNLNTYRVPHQLVINEARLMARKTTILTVLLVLFSVNVVSADMFVPPQPDTAAHSTLAYENALAKSRELTKGDTGHIFTDAYVDQGDYLVKLGRYDEALVAYNNALDKTFINQDAKKAIEAKRNAIMVQQGKGGDISITPTYGGTYI